MKQLLLSVLLIILLSLTVSPSAVLSKSDGPGDVNATDIQIVKKVTLQGSMAKGGKAVLSDATGILGAPCTGKKYAVVVGIKDGNYPLTSPFICAILRV